MVRNAFADTVEAVRAARVEQHASWVPLCTSVRVQPGSVQGFPVTIDYLPNVQNKSALQAMGAIFAHTSSTAWTLLFEDAIAKAVRLDNGHAMVFELQKLDDCIEGHLANCYSKLIVAVAAQKLHLAGDASLRSVTIALSKLHLVVQAAKAFVDGASKQVDKLPEVVSASWKHELGHWEALEANYTALHGFIVADLKEGLVMNMKVRPSPPEWKERLVDKASPAGVQEMLSDPAREELVVTIAKVALNSELLSDALSDIGTSSATPDEAVRDRIAELRMFACVWSAWQLMVSQVKSVRQRQGMAAAKEAKIKAQLKGIDSAKWTFPVEVKSYLDKWTKAGDAFAKADS